MKRILAIGLPAIVFVIALILLFFILSIDGLTSISIREYTITSLILTSLELVGLAFAIYLAIFILVQYFRYRLRQRLVFEAFSNEPKLVDDEKKPLNLSMLAREELIRQFKIIYNELKEYLPEESQEELEAWAVDEIFVEKDSSGKNFGTYVSEDQINKSDMIQGLKDVIQTLTDPDDINLMHLVGEIAPQEISPVVKLIEAIIPPRTIRATGHLQWERDEKVGITFEFVDLANRRDLMVRTIWWKREPPDGSDQADNDVTNPEKTKYEYYVDLLSPAMHWMALMFLEQKLLSGERPLDPILNIFDNRENERQARVLYILGALYYAHADQFPAYRDFFCQLAVEHFSKALVKYESWPLPYLYLANLYSLKMRDLKMQEEKEEKSEKLLKEARKMSDTLLKEALTLYGKAEEYAKQDIFMRHRIIIAKALAELDSEDDDLAKIASKDLERMEIEQNPVDFNPEEQPGCSAYLFNLATWYLTAYDQYKGIPNALEKGRRYLAYWLARYPDQWSIADESFKNIAGEIDLEPLKQELTRKLAENRKLSNLTGEVFKIEIDTVLQTVDQELEHQEEEQTA